MDGATHPYPLPPPPGEIVTAEIMAQVQLTIPCPAESFPVARLATPDVADV